jgi:glutamate synthase (NADPH/NADH) large chain
MVACGPSRDVIVAALLGAEEFGVSTAALIATGCIMLRKCHLNTCSVGIATQDPRLREKFTGTPEDVVNLFTFMAEAVRERLAALGVRSLDELIGRASLLRVKPAVDAHWKLRTLDLSRLLAGTPARFVAAVPHDLGDHVDHDLIRRAEPALVGGKSVELALPIDNSRRAVGTLLSGEIARRTVRRGCPMDRSTCGSAVRPARARRLPRAGRLARAVRRRERLRRQGHERWAHRGLSAAGARFAPEANVIIGNVALYGATAGELFASGLAGERFAVRNSGARAVVEGVGDHGCEYMTGGAVVVLGPTGRNFAAGMSGGTAYVYDPTHALRSRTTSRWSSSNRSSTRSRCGWSTDDRGPRPADLEPARSPALDNWEHLVRASSR